MDLGRAWTLETDDEPDEGAPHLSAKALRLCGYVLAAFFVAVVLDGPAPLRLPLSLAMVLAVPGLTLVGLMRVEDRAMFASLVVGVSLALSMLVASVLVSFHSLSAGGSAVALVAVCTPGLLIQARRSLLGGA
jgi:hypothetical protein